MTDLQLEMMLTDVTDQLTTLWSGNWPGWITFLLRDLEDHIDLDPEDYDAVLVEVAHQCLKRVRDGSW